MPYGMYTEENEGWVVTELDVSTSPSSLLVFNELSPSNWTETIRDYSPATAVILTCVFTRAGNYYVLNLFFPLLVIVIVSNATIFMPSDVPEKAELQVLIVFTYREVLNAFVLIITF